MKDSSPTRAQHMGSAISAFKHSARETFARRGTSIWALLGFAGDLCAFGSGVHFDNPARMASMALGMGVASMLWAWGDYGDDKIKGNTLYKGMAYARNQLRHVTDFGLIPQHMQKAAFVLNIGTGMLLCVAGLDLTHPRHIGFIGRDFRPIEMFYGFCIATAFLALSVEDKLPNLAEARQRFGKALGGIFYKENMRKIATICFMPCGAGQIAAGFVNHDPFVLSAGALQTAGSLALWYSTRIQKQMERALTPEEPKGLSHLKPLSEKFLEPR